MKSINIESIRSLGKINQNLLNTWADACSILLDFRSHSTPVKFDIEGPISEKTELCWKPVANKAGYEDLEDTAGMAGYGIGLLIVTTFTDVVPVQRRAKGDGVDIVCSKDIQDDDNFLNTTTEDYYIECKGSRSKKYVRPYLNDGVKQSKDAPGNVYVISAEFETPSALTHFRK